MSEFNRKLYTLKLEPSMIELQTSMENDKFLWRVLKNG